MLVLASKQVAVRLARPDEGALVRDLQKNSGGGVEIADLDWSDIGHHWLVAEYDGAPVGCICVLYGKPVSFFHEMYVDRTEPHRVQALTVRTLLLAALASCREYGSVMAHGLIPHQLTSYKRALERRGAIKWYDGSSYIVRL